MANIKSAKKRARQAVKGRLHNIQIKSKVRTAIRKVEQAIVQKDQKKAMELLQVARSESTKAARKRIFPANKVSRDISKLNSKIKALEVA